MTDDKRTRADELLAVVGGGAGILAMAVWGLYVTFPEPASPLEILSTGLLTAVIYGTFGGILCIWHSRATRRVENGVQKQR